jgi:hypothetical protein
MGIPPFPPSLGGESNSAGGVKINIFVIVQNGICHHFGSRIIALPDRLCHDVGMVKRSSRLAKRNALRAVEEAIGSALGKNPASAGLARAGTEARDPRVEKPLRRPKTKGK